MNILLCGEFDIDRGDGERERWHQALAAAMPEARWLDLDDVRRSPDVVQAAVVANPAPGSLQGLPRLRLIQSLWAGVDRLLSDTTLPAGVPIARMVDPSLNRAMAETVQWALLSLQRGFFDYAQQQSQQRWLQLPQRRAEELNVLVLGQGQMGMAAADRLAAMGYHVRGWRRDDAPLPRLLAGSHVVVNLLPLTPATKGLLNAEFYADLPRGASVVNLGRGAHVVDDDLLAALDSGHLERAVLDVFHTEPLPASHPFWTHPRITVLPHAAAATDPRSAAAVAVANLRALRDGRPVANPVERGRGY